MTRSISRAGDAASSKLGLLDRIQPLLLVGSIGIGLGFARWVPGFAQDFLPVVTVGVFLVIYFIMLGVEFQGVLGAFKRWKLTTLAIGINFAFTPLFAWLLGYFFLHEDPDIWAGLILYLVTPCIGWYLVFTELAKGDVELGISLLAWNVFLQIALMPVYMKLLAGTIVYVDVGEILHSVAVFLALPLLLAMLTRNLVRWRTGSMEALANKVRLPYVKTTTLMAVIVAMFASQGGVLFKNPALVLKMIAPGLVFFAVAFAVALAVGKIFRLKYEEVALLTFTITARNSEASLAVAVTAFTNPLVPLTVVIGPGIELPVLILILRALLWIREGWVYASPR